MVTSISFLVFSWFNPSIFYYLFLKDDNAACVGLCYHNKLQALKEEKNEDYSRGWPLNMKKFVDQPPCVGLCQMLRALNLPNTFDGRFQHTGTRPTPSPTTKSTARPS